MFRRADPNHLTPLFEWEDLHRRAQRSMDSDQQPNKMKQAEVMAERDAVRRSAVDRRVGVKPEPEGLVR